MLHTLSPTHTHTHTVHDLTQHTHTLTQCMILRNTRTHTSTTMHTLSHTKYILHIVNPPPLSNPAATRSLLVQSLSQSSHSFRASYSSSPVSLAVRSLDVHLLYTIMQHSSCRICVSQHYVTEVEGGRRSAMYVVADGRTVLHAGMQHAIPVVDGERRSAMCVV